MLNDIISVFNQLTRSELADCSLFENIINRHYEKFKYFYSIIDNINLKSIIDIDCQEESTKLNIYISFKTKKERDTFFNIFINKINNRCSFKYKDYFIFNVMRDTKCINITIENNDIIMEEVIYGCK